MQKTIIQNKPTLLIDTQLLQINNQSDQYLFFDSTKKEFLIKLINKFSQRELRQMSIFTPTQDENVQIRLNNSSNQILNIDSSSSDNFTSSQNDLSQSNKRYNMIEKLPLEINRTIIKSNNMIKTSKIKKNKKQKKLQTIAQDKVYINLNPYSTIQICPGISITCDGIIRLDSCISQVIFEQQQFPHAYIKEDKNLGIVDISVEIETQFEKHQIEDILKYISKIPDQMYHDIVQNIHKYRDIMQFYKEKADEIDISEEMFQQKDEQFNKYSQDCYEYFKKLRQENPYAMYQYGIGRFNMRSKKFEFSKGGYSQSYLELLGIESDSFITMLLRNKEVDLLLNKFDSNNLSQIGLNFLVNNIKNEKYFCYIKTFDGFPLKLYQTQKIIGLPSQTFQPINSFNENMLCLTEFDVEFQELQNLINYRKKISQKNSNLTIHELIQKELSYNFEDVEYSVLSQSFIEKYYQENLAKLQEIEQQYYKRKEIESKQCSYKLINQQ